MNARPSPLHDPSVPLRAQGVLLAFALAGCGGAPAMEGSDSGAPVHDGALPDAPREGSGPNRSEAGPDADASVTPEAGWEYAKIGGGGFITGGQVSSDGTKVFRTDTSGAYSYDDTTGDLSQ